MTKGSGDRAQEQRATEISMLEAKGSLELGKGDCGQGSLRCSSCSSADRAVRDAVPAALQLQLKKNPVIPKRLSSGSRELPALSIFVCW